MLPSRLLDNAVNQFSRLPGVGRKTALRLVLHMLRQDNEFMDVFTGALTQMKREIKHCVYAITSQIPMCALSVPTIAEIQALCV